MMGIGRIYDSLSAQWIEWLETRRNESLPMVAVSPGTISSDTPDSTPSVLLDVEKRPEMHELIRTLQSAGSDLEYFVVWCALIASDLSIADTFLLVTVRKPIECKLTLRFHLLRHRTTLEMIDQVRKLAIYTEHPNEFVVIDVNVPDLEEQLAQVRKYQEDMLK